MDRLILDYAVCPDLMSEYLVIISVSLLELDVDEVYNVSKAYKGRGDALF